MKSAGNYSLCNHHPGVDCVHADFAWAEFLRQCSRDRIDSAFRCVVNNRGRWSQRAGKRTDINDAAAFGGEMLECFLSGEKHSENVGIKHFVELLLGDVFERHEFVNASVVNQNVELTKSLLRCGKKLFDVVLLRDASLNCDCFPAALRDFIYYAICVLLGRRIIN